MLYRRVLAATDLSDNAARAARLAASLLHPEGQMRLVRVVQVPERHDFMSLVYRQEVERVGGERRARAREETDAWAQRHELPAHETSVREGSPRDAVLSAVKEMQADLVALGHSSHGRVGEALLGSTAKSVLHHAHCDVLVAPSRDLGGARVRRVVLATDFYGPAKEAARRALSIARASGASLTALHVIDTDLWSAVAYDAPAMQGARPDRAWLEKNVGEMLHQFNEDALGGAAEEALRHGRPADEVARHVREHDVDLVVVGTHGAGALERALVGSVAEKIVERAPCPVLVAKETHSTQPAPGAP